MTIKIINLRIDGQMFKQMKKDKEANDFDNWESYILDLFHFRKESEMHGEENEKTI